MVWKGRVTRLEWLDDEHLCIMQTVHLLDVCLCRVALRTACCDDFCACCDDPLYMMLYIWSFITRAVMILYISSFIYDPLLRVLWWSFIYDALYMILYYACCDDPFPEWLASIVSAHWQTGTVPAPWQTKTPANRGLSQRHPSSYQSPHCSLTHLLCVTGMDAACTRAIYTLASKTLCQNESLCWRYPSPF